MISKAARLSPSLSRLIGEIRIGDPKLEIRPCPVLHSSAVQSPYVIGIRCTCCMKTVRLMLCIERQDLQLLGQNR